MRCYTVTVHLTLPQNYDGTPADVAAAIRRRAVEARFFNGGHELMEATINAVYAAEGQEHRAPPVVHACKQGPKGWAPRCNVRVDRADGIVLASGAVGVTCIACRSMLGLP